MGELIRYAKRSSSQIAFVRMQTLFWERLWLRGYTRDFLPKAFAMAPTYSDVRARLMAPPPQPATTTDRCFVLVLNTPGRLRSSTCPMFCTSTSTCFLYTFGRDAPSLPGACLARSWTTTTWRGSRALSSGAVMARAFATAAGCRQEDAAHASGRHCGSAL
jgi:hypothetical protein